MARLLRSGEPSWGADWRSRRPPDLDAGRKVSQRNEVDGDAVAGFVDGAVAEGDRLGHWVTPSAVGVFA